jgi:Glycosyl transferases group 1
VMDSYAAQTERPIDVLFVGGYSRHHRQRAIILESVAALRHNLSVAFHLDRSRMTRLAETPLGWAGPLARHRRPAAIRAVSKEPVFGRQLYAALGQAKIVLNGAVDMAGSDRGNMRCWEAMGCGALLLSDSGSYPSGMKPGKNFLTYRDATDAVQKIIETLNSSVKSAVPCFAHKMISTHFSKNAQWLAFCELAI